MNRSTSMFGLVPDGESCRGMAAVERNLKAMTRVCDAVKTSFGPLGLDKICVDSAGEVSVTNDGATILQNMLVEDPAEKILVDLATQQDKDVGDGTVTVVLLATSLVENGMKLMSSGTHLSTVLSGYRMAVRESSQFLKNNISRNVTSSLQKAAANVVKTSMSSKVISCESAFFCELALSALKLIESVDANKKTTYAIEDINILKHPGGSMRDSFLHEGYVLNCSLASSAMKKCIKKPKIICLDLGLQKYKSPLTAAVVVDDPEKLEDIRKKEIDISKNRIRSLLNTGANVILTTKGIDDMCASILEDAGAMGVRRCKKEDLVAISKAIGIPLLSDISDLSGGEDVSMLGAVGTAEKIEVLRVGSEECLFISTSGKKIASIILRGANHQILDEVHRSIHDGLCALKRVLMSKSVVPGGGATECALSVHLEKFASTVNSKEHVALHRYSESILSIPRALCANAGLDSNEMLAKLLFEQGREGTSHPESKFFGLDVTTGTIQDNFDAGIIEPTISKMKSLKAAAEAAACILRVNEIIDLPPDKDKN